METCRLNGRFFLRARRQRAWRLQVKDDNAMTFTLHAIAAPRFVTILLQSNENLQPRIA
jgi:hypothetical protein